MMAAQRRRTSSATMGSPGWSGCSRARSRRRAFRAPPSMCSTRCRVFFSCRDRKSTRLNSSHAEIYTLSLHDALPIWLSRMERMLESAQQEAGIPGATLHVLDALPRFFLVQRSEEHTSELQSRRDLHSFPTRRSSDLALPDGADARERAAGGGHSGRHPPCARRAAAFFSRAAWPRVPRLVSWLLESPFR